MDNLKEKIKQLIGLEVKRADLLTELEMTIAQAALDYDALSEIELTYSYSKYVQGKRVIDTSMRKVVNDYREIVRITYWINEESFECRLDDAGDSIDYTVPVEYILKDPEERYKEIMDKRKQYVDGIENNEREKEERAAREQYEMLKRRFEKQL